MSLNPTTAYDDEDEPLGTSWRAPDGTPIVGTLETIEGCTCGITPNGDGTYDFDGTGTDVNWDGQATVVRAGQTVFYDAEGVEWLESQIIKDPAAPLPEVVADIWDDDTVVRRHANQVVREFLSLTAPSAKIDAAAGMDVSIIANLMQKLATSLRNTP